MRIVDLYQMSEEERRKALEEQQSLYNERMRQSDEIRREANEQFNNLVSSQGEYDTTRHTTTIGNLRNTYKNLPGYNNINEYYNKNKKSMWEIIKDFASGTGKTVENTWLGLVNGTKSSGQTMGQAITNSQADRFDFLNEQNKKMLEKRLEEHPEESEQIKNAINNPLISGDDIRKEAEETTKKIQEEKKENTKKIQQNVEAMDTPVGKYLAGDIMPSVGQMLPGLVGGDFGTTYFISSATGNYYDEAKERGMNNDEATKYSGIMGIIEGSLESIGGKLTTNVGKNLLKKNIKGALVNYGLDIAENFLEESVVEPLSELVAETTAGKDKANWNNMGERFLKSGINGAVTAMITGGTSGLIGKAGASIQENQYRDMQTGEILSKDNQNILKQAENIINENNTSNLQQQSTQSEQILPTQQINQEQNNVAQNENINEFNGYTDKEINNIESNKITVAKSNEDIINFVNSSKKVPSNRKMYLGKIKENISNYINEKFGINIGNYNISLKTDAIRHTENNHTNLEKETSRGQIPLVAEDYANIPVIINNPDNVSIDGKTQQGKPVIKFEKNIDGNNVVVTYVSDKHNNLELQTMYKFKNNKKMNPATASNELNSSNRTSETNSGTDSFINNSIPPIDNNVNSDTITNNYAQNNENNTQNEKNPTRHEVIQENREIAKENIKNISKWKDKKRGLSYQLETMERNMFDIIPDKAEAQKINDTYFNPIHESEAQKQRFINKYNDRIKEFNLNKYESEAVQLLGEQKYNPDFKAEEVQEILDKVNNNIEKGKIDVQKVNEAIETFRNIYDELFELENNALKENGYKEKPYRKGYFPHFIDYVPETRAEKVLNKLGFKIDKRPLPTDIAGITEQFVPGKTWNKSSLERKGNKTDYNALKGFDTYIAQASDNIFHTENIQRLRGLENEIRYQYSDKGIQERVDNILNDETLFEDEKQQLLDQILEQTNNPMPNLVTELRRYTNALANKKSEADRSIENMMGRSVYSTVNAIENRFGANAVGLNIGSAFTNIIPITQAWSQVSTKNMGRAVIDTVKSYINNDGFVDNSAFLTSRINQSEKLYKTSIEKISDKTSFLFNAIDEVTSNIVVRSKYLDNIQNGMSESEAIKNADQFARNVIADRSKGAIPTKFEEKNPITKAFTQFQLEVNNQYRYMFKDLPRDLKEKGLGSIALAFFKMFVGAWLYNEASEKVTGRRPAFDPIDIATSAYKDITDEKKGTYDKIASIGKNVAEELPFVGGLVGGGRIPVNGAIPDVGNLTKAGIGLATGEMDSNKAISNIGKEVAKPLYYLLPPFGGAQIKKSTEGISTIANGGSYGVDSKGKETLQFPVENPDAMDYIKAGIFGKYALPLAKEYTDNNFKSLNANQTKTYKESKIPYKEYLEYLNQDLKKNEDKITYINKQKWGENQKWGIYTNELFSDEKRKDGGSQLEDANYAIKNGTSKAEYMKLYEETNKRSMNLPTQDEQEELKEKGISLKNFVDYQTKVHDETKKRKENGTLDENKQLKNKDKIEILVNSNYSDSEKEAIYKKSINSQDKKIQVVDELGLPITQYLKYRQQDFVNDKDSNGETISGTKKQKVYNYLNSISDSTLSQDYKKLLCKMEGITAYDSDVARLVVNNNNLTTDKQKEILKTLGFKVDKNGNISTTTMIPRNKAVK